MQGSSEMLIIVQKSLYMIYVSIISSTEFLKLEWQTTMEIVPYGGELEEPCCLDDWLYLSIFSLYIFLWLSRWKIEFDTH